MMSHMPSHVSSLGLKPGVWSQGCGSGHMLPSHVAPSQVLGSGGWLGNWSGDEVGEASIRLKNDLGTLHTRC